MQQQQWSNNVSQNNVPQGHNIEPSGSGQMDDNLGTITQPPSSYNQKTTERMKHDEGMFLNKKYILK